MTGEYIILILFVSIVHELCRLKIHNFLTPSPLLVVFLLGKIGNFRWGSDWLNGAVVARCLGTPGQTKESGYRQRKTTHELCCLAAK